MCSVLTPVQLHYSLIVAVLTQLEGTLKSWVFEYSRVDSSSFSQSGLWSVCFSVRARACLSKSMHCAKPSNEIHNCVQYVVIPSVDIMAWEGKHLEM